MFTKIKSLRVDLASPIVPLTLFSYATTDLQHELLSMMREVGQGTPLIMAELMAGGGYSWRNDAPAVRDALCALYAVGKVRTFDVWVEYEGNMGGGASMTAYTVIDDDTVGSYQVFRNYMFYGEGVQRV